MIKIKGITKDDDIFDATYSQIKYIFLNCFTENGTSKNKRIDAIRNTMPKFNLRLIEAKKLVDTICEIQTAGIWFKYLPCQHIIKGMNISHHNDEIYITDEEVFEPIEAFMYG